MIMRFILIFLAFLALTGVAAGINLQDQVVEAMENASKFFRTEISCRGGYLGEYSKDLAEWVGEGKAKPYQIWIQPPGTPSVGLVYLRAYEVRGDERYLEAASAVADALIWGQLVAGGWHYIVDFLGESEYRYRHEVPDDPTDRNTCTFDDDVSQHAIRLMMAVDGVLNCDPYTDAVNYALDFMMESQFPNGAWPQRYPLVGDYPKHYSDYYTFNDNAINDCIDVMMEAYTRYGDERYLESAERGGDFIILSQIDQPQAGWAQQYYWNLTPAWARDFEPPAVCSKVTSNNIKTLLELYLLTGNEAYLEPIPAAVEWLNNSMIDENLWARFYELGTNIPIYCDRDRKLTYNLSELGEERRHGYGWQGRYGMSGMNMYNDVISKGREQYLADRNRELTEAEKSQKAAGLEQTVRECIDALDDQGRWVEDGWIYTKTFNRNMGYFIRYLEYSGWNGTAPSIPEIDSFSLKLSGDAILLTANTTHPQGLERISEVALRFTPWVDMDDLLILDDGSGVDLVKGDGCYSLLFKPTERVSSSYHGLLVVEDLDGHWNFTSLPLGMFVEIVGDLKETQSDLIEAQEIEIDVTSFASALAEIEAGLGSTWDETKLGEILTELGNLTKRLEVATVLRLIEMAAEVVDQAKEMGFETSRYEIFLMRAREEFEKGNYGPARKFTDYPLSLRKIISEPVTYNMFSLLVFLMVVPQVVLSVFRRLLA